MTKSTKYFLPCFLLVSIFAVGCTKTQIVTTNPSTNKQEIVDAESSAEDDSAIAKINVQLGIAYLESGNVPRAKQKLLLARDRAPGDPLVWYALGYFLEQTGEEIEADKAYQKAISLAPTKGESLNNYGTFLCRQGKNKQAIEYFIRATDDQSYVQVAEAYENAGTCALKIPDIASAETYFERALKKNPNQTKSMIELAEIKYNKNQFKEALELLTRLSIRVEPNERMLKLGVRLGNRLGNRELVSKNLNMLREQSMAS